MALVQLATASGGLLGHQAVDAVLAVLPLPAGLRRHAVAERPADLLLRGQPRLTQRDRHQPQMDLVGQGDAVERFVPAEDDAVAVAIDEPHRGVEKGAAVGRRFFQGQQRLGGGVRVHAINDARRLEKVPDKPFTHSAALIPRETREIPENRAGYVRRSDISTTAL